MVFHTAPPQPCSKARCTWAPEFVGGAEASQNGFGDLIPAKLMLRSAMCCHLHRAEPLMNCRGPNLPVLRRHDGRCGTFYAHAIAPGVNARHTRLQRSVHLNETPLRLQPEQICQRGALL